MRVRLLQYKKTVGRILELPWEKLDAPALVKLMFLSGFAAREFAESLKLSLGLYPDYEGLREMADEELKTRNLRYKDYGQKGDHWEFLAHFLRGINPLEFAAEFRAGARYWKEVNEIIPEVRAMSIFSRESELPDIFTRILEAGGSQWTSSETLEAFKYYLERHVALDSSDGGHADMIAGCTIDDRVDRFYRARLRLYETIFPGLCSV